MPPSGSFRSSLCSDAAAVSRLNITWPVKTSDADFMPNLASFLLVRGPYAWFGNAWQGCNKVPERRAELDADYGAPLGPCEAAQEPGVFTREWSKATITMDCNTWTPTIAMK